MVNLWNNSELLFNNFFKCCCYEYTDFQDKSLLIVDDDDPLRGRLARAMEKKGFITSEAKSIEEGLRLISDKPPRFAVVDLRLDDGNGLDLVKQLSNKKNLTFPVY